jgi:hypothetical protein
MNKQYPAARQLRFTPAGKNRGCHHCRPASHNHINGAQNPLVSNDECSATSHVKLTCVASPRHHPSSPTNHSRPIPLWFQKGHGQSGRGVAQRRGSPARRRLEIPVLPSPPAAHTLALTASRLVALRKGRRVKSRRRVRAGNPEGEGCGSSSTAIQGVVRPSIKTFRFCTAIDALQSSPIPCGGLGFRARPASLRGRGAAALQSDLTPLPALARSGVRHAGAVRFEIRASLSDQGLGSASGPPRHRAPGRLALA